MRKTKKNAASLEEKEEILESGMFEDDSGGPDFLFEPDDDTDALAEDTALSALAYSREPETESLTEMEEQILYWARLVERGKVRLPHTPSPNEPDVMEKAARAIHAMRDACAENRAQVERRIAKLQKRRRTLRRRLDRLGPDCPDADFHEKVRLQYLHRCAMREICALRSALDMAAHGRVCGAAPRVENHAQKV